MVASAMAEYWGWVSGVKPSNCKNLSLSRRYSEIETSTVLVVVVTREKVVMSCRLDGDAGEVGVEEVEARRELGPWATSSCMNQSAIE